MDVFFAQLNQTGIIFVLGLFSCCSAFLSGLCLLLYFKSRSLQKELWQEIGDLRRRIESLPAWNNQSVPLSSKTSFGKEELKSRLEKFSAQEKQVPGKYRHLASLERSGLGSHEIAEILDVSPQEAEQMLSLVRRAQESKSQIPD
jgi:hypothetical protein